MFRKDSQLKALSNLKSSERRRMLGAIIDTYSLPQGMAKETEESFLPMVVMHAKFKTIKGKTGTIYTDEEQTPIWFKTRDSELIPTVFTLWKAPFILPIVHTHPHVIGIIEGGADLMLPGTVPPFDQRIKKGAIVGVADTKDTRLVKAVGRANFNLFLYEKTVGSTGMAVEIFHSYGDTLCQVANHNIKPPAELDIEIKFNELEVTEREPEQGIEEETQRTEEGAQEAREESILEAQQEIQEEERQDAEARHDGEEVDDESDQLKLTAEDIDHFFKRSLFQTLTHEPKLELPLNASAFMNHIVNNLLMNHESIQMKKTSWKKSPKFLKEMEKEGFLKLKGKADDLTVVSAANKDNSDQLKNFVPYKVKKSKPATKREDPQNKRLILKKYYKPKSDTREIFNELNLDYFKFYTTDEVKNIINSYISKNDLVNQKNKKQIILNDTLKSVIKGNDNTLGRDKILSLFLAKFSEFYKFLDPNQEEDNSPPMKGQVPKVEIVTENKIGNKVITRISNIEPFGVSPEEFSSQLKVKCSGSSTIVPNVQNPKLVAVTVQGPHSKTAIDLLSDKYGLNQNWINFTDKTRKKKKRS